MQLWLKQGKEVLAHERARYWLIELVIYSGEVWIPNSPMRDDYNNICNYCTLIIPVYDFVFQLQFILKPLFLPKESEEQCKT